MYVSYFNHNFVQATGRRATRAFLRKWWRFYERDSHWVPPYYPLLQRLLQKNDSPYLVRREPKLFYADAVSRREPGRGRQAELHPGATLSIWESTVAATVALRAANGTAHLGLLRCVNDRRTLSYFLQQVAEESGLFTLMGPTHLSPYLGAGALDSHWHLNTPLHTPYNPPFLIELLEGTMEAVLTSHLYHLPLPPEPLALPEGPAQLSELQPQQLAKELLPLLSAACRPWRLFPLPDTSEAAFLLHWLEQWPLQGWLAKINERAVGFVLLQGDLGPTLQRAKGGRTLLRRWWYRTITQKTAEHGRLLFGAVLPDWRRQGIGTQLMRAALVTAAQQKWQTLRIGPLPDDTAGVPFLQSQGAEPRQRYRLFRWQGSGWF